MSNELRNRTSKPRGLHWLLLDGDRVHVATALLFGILAVLAAVAALGLFPREPSNPMFFLFSAILGGNLTLITVVLSINQLVLSRELGAPGELNQRIRDAVAYRREVEDVAELGPSPVSPEEFLRYLHEALNETARELEQASVEGANDRLTTRIEKLVEELTTDAEAVTRTLDGSTVNIFGVIEATLGTNHAAQLYEVSAIESEFDSLTDRQRRVLDRLEDQLLHIDTARKYFRTVYMEKELSVLSRLILYVGVPAEVITAIALAVYGAVGATPAPSPWLLPFALGALTAGFAPLAVLFAFILRLSWVAQQNTSVAPFSAEKNNRSV